MNARRFLYLVLMKQNTHVRSEKNRTPNRIRITAAMVSISGDVEWLKHVEVAEPNDRGCKVGQLKMRVSAEALIILIVYHLYMWYNMIA